MKFDLSLNRKNVPSEELISDMRGVASRLGKNSVTIEEYNELGRFSSSTITRRFKSWFKALSLANLDASRSPLNISNEELFSNLQAIWEKLGRQPKYNEIMKPSSKYHAGTYENRFGSWNNALESFIQYIETNDLECEIVPTDLNEEGIDLFPKNELEHKTRRQPSNRLRFKILLRDGFTCQSCGSSPLKERDVELHVDHIVPWSKGGETIESNLTTKCSKCNLGKGNMCE